MCVCGIILFTFLFVKMLLLFVARSLMKVVYVIVFDGFTIIDVIVTEAVVNTVVREQYNRL